MTDTLNKAAEGTPDLEKIRDERCLPVARLVLNDLAADLIPEEAGEDAGKIDARGLAEKMLTHMFDADLNTTTETPYVPQLVLGMLAGLNACVQEATVYPIDESRLNAIARKILANMAEQGQTIDLTKKVEENREAYAPITAFLNDVFAAEELTYIEIKYIMDKIFNSFTILNNLVSGSLEDSMKRSEQKLFGVSDMSEITMKKLHEILTTS